MSKLILAIPWFCKLSRVVKAAGPAKRGKTSGIIVALEEAPSSLNISMPKVISQAIAIRIKPPATPKDDISTPNLDRTASPAKRKSRSTSPE